MIDKKWDDPSIASGFYTTPMGILEIICFRKKPDQLPWWRRVLLRQKPNLKAVYVTQQLQGKSQRWIRRYMNGEWSDFNPVIQTWDLATKSGYYNKSEGSSNEPVPDGYMISAPSQVKDQHIVLHVKPNGDEIWWKRHWISGQWTSWYVFKRVPFPTDD